MFSRFTEKAIQAIMLAQEDAKRFQATLQQMHDSVIRMSDLAGKEDGLINPMAPDKNS